MPLFKRKAKVEPKKVREPVKISVQHVVDCVNCNKKYTDDGNKLCVPCRQV